MGKVLQENFLLIGISLVVIISIVIGIVRKPDGQTFYRKRNLSLTKREYEEYKYESENSINNTVIGISDCEIYSSVGQTSPIAFLDKEIDVGSFLMSKENFSLKEVGDV